MPIACRRDDDVEAAACSNAAKKAACEKAREKAEAQLKLLQAERAAVTEVSPALINRATAYELTFEPNQSQG